ncbi:MAG: zinc finger domain-containing protein, partial [Novosphingobium sp.]
TKWSDARPLRRAITEAIEPLRREKIVGSSLEAEVVIPIAGGGSFERDIRSLDLAELCIVSSVLFSDVVEPDSLTGPFSVTKTTHHKCGRCWRHLPEVTEDGSLCSRCDHVVAGIDAHA